MINKRSIPLEEKHSYIYTTENLVTHKCAILIVITVTSTSTVYPHILYIKVPVRLHPE